MTDFQAVARQYATQANIDPNIFVAQIQQESGFNPNAKSPAGALGIAQFMPATAQSMNVNPMDPIAALKAAAYLDSATLQKYGGDYKKMLAAYNCGGGCVDSAVARGGSNWLSLTPAETQNYVATIMNKRNPGASPAPTQAQQQQTGSGNAIIDTLKQWGEYVAIFVLAAVLIIIGFVLLAEKQARQLARKVVP